MGKAARLRHGATEAQVLRSVSPSYACFKTLTRLSIAENTLASFAKACEDGADGIETDIHMTLDNRLVMFHDPELSRTTDGKGKIHSLPWEGVIE
jgi:glycerophosphoryl diester phosphodiesterase